MELVQDVICGAATRKPSTEPYPRINRYSLVKDDRMEVAFFEAGEGARIPEHVHEDARTVGIVIAGEVECTLGGERKTLTPGSVFSTPVGEPHGPFHYKADTRELKLFLFTKAEAAGLADECGEVDPQHQIKLVKPQDARGEVREIYNDIVQSEGSKWLVPLWGFFAHSPALLRHWWGLLKTLEIESGSVPKKLISGIAMMTAIESDCKRCTNYHQATLIDRLGIAVDQVDALRDYENSPLLSEEERKAIRFARNVAFGGQVTADDIRELRAMGYTDLQLTEIVSVAILEMGFARRGVALSKFEDVDSWPPEHIPSDGYAKHLAD